MDDIFVVRSPVLLIGSFPFRDASTAEPVLVLWLLRKLINLLLSSRFQDISALLRGLTKTSSESAPREECIGATLGII